MPGTHTHDNEFLVSVRKKEKKVKEITKTDLLSGEQSFL